MRRSEGDKVVLVVASQRFPREVCDTVVESGRHAVGLLASLGLVENGAWGRLGGGRDVIGSAITLDERPYTVSGVMPPAFQLPVAGTAMARSADVWIPLVPSPSDANRNSRPYFAYARRKPGVSLEQAQADVRRVAVTVAAAYPQRYQFYTA